MLFRAFYALPDTIKGADGQPVNALLGTANLILREIEEHEPARRGALLRPRRGRLPRGAVRRLPRGAPRGAGHARAAVPRRAAFFEAFGWIVADSDSLEADDLLGSLRQARDRGGRPHARDDRRPRHVPVRRRPACRCSTCAPAASRAPSWWTPPRSKRRYGVPPELVPDFIALRGDPSDGIPGAKGIGEKTRRRAAPAPRLARGGDRTAACARPRRPCAPRSARRRDELRAFKEIATLQDVDVERPPDTPDRLRRRGRSRARARHGAAREASRGARRPMNFEFAMVDRVCVDFEAARRAK